MSNRVRLNRSTIPLHCGWYGVVRVFLICNSLHISFTKSDSNRRPWSLSGGEKRQNISSTSFLATVVASWFRIAYTSTHRVKQSTATMTYLQPSSVSGRGPIKSTLTICIGYPALMVCRGALLFGATVFLAVQLMQFLHHSPTASVHPGQ